MDIREIRMKALELAKIELGELPRNIELLFKLANKFEYYITQGLDNLHTQSYPRELIGTMSFDDAVTHMNKGKIIRRKAWHRKNIMYQYESFRKYCENDLNKEDMCATDWVVIY